MPEVIVRGKPAPPPDAEEQKVFAVSASLERLHTFATFLFGGTATIAALATALGVNGFGSLDGDGRTLFAFAVAALAASLVAAVAALVPLSRTYEPNRPGSQQDAVQSVLRWRTRSLVIAAVLFAIALGLAGFSPLASSREAERARRAPAAITWQLGEGGRLGVLGALRHAEPFSPATLRLSPEPNAPAQLRPSVRAVTNSDGAANLKLATRRTGRARAVVAALSYVVAGGGKAVIEERIVVRQRVAPRGPGRRARRRSRPRR